jgi:hypothetical protein
MRFDLVSRRALVARSLMVAPAVGSMALAARSALAAQACADPTDSLRASLHYTEASPDPAKTCSACGFFDAEGEDGCGSCKIFNGPTNPKGHCDSWAAKG